MFREERAQVSFEYLLTAAFGIMLAIGAAMVVETLRQIALSAQSDLLSERARLIENILQ
jgi:TRAP-type C4-dicarboxylate transport system permease small subunit